MNAIYQGADAVIIGRRKEVIESAAKELSHKSGRRCIGISADVRSSESLKAAAKQATSEFGRIDFVICGAAGNFLSPVSLLTPETCHQFHLLRIDRRVV